MLLSVGKIWVGGRGGSCVTSALVPTIEPNANLHSGKFEKNRYFWRTSGQNQKLHFKNPHFYGKRMHLGFESALCAYWFQRYGQTLMRTVGNLKKSLYLKNQ